MAAGVTLATFQMPNGEYISLPHISPGDMRVLTLTLFRLGMANSLSLTSITIGISTCFHLVRPPKSLLTPCNKTNPPHIGASQRVQGTARKQLSFMRHYTNPPQMAGIARPRQRSVRHSSQIPRRRRSKQSIRPSRICGDDSDNPNGHGTKETDMGRAYLHKGQYKAVRACRLRWNFQPVEW